MARLPHPIHESWYPILTPLLTLNSVEKIRTEVLTKCEFCPSSENIFNVFEMPVDQVRVVLIGQDPYPNPDMALGYSFAIPKSAKLTASLRIIFEELGIQSYEPLDRDLEYWKQQGVFLLNAALTVEKGKPGSHMKHWEEFTRGLVTSIDSVINPVWLLLGQKAQAFSSFISHKDRIVEAGHPASEVYPGVKGRFLTQRPFERVNEKLLINDKIIWS